MSEISKLEFPWRALDREVIAAADHVFTLLDDEEQLMLFHYGREASHDGAIVDLGCHLGGSTARLALGARAGGYAGEIHLFDRFEVKYPRAKLNARLPAALRDFGDTDDTEAIVRALLAPIDANFVLHNGEFMDMAWVGAPVSLLFVDIGKNLRTMDHVAAEFYPSLIAGTSIVIQQDYQYEWNPWVAAHCELWADKFEVIGYTDSESVIYRAIAPISADEAATRRMEDLENHELKALFAAARARFAGTNVAKRLDAIAARIGDDPFPRRTIGKKFIKLKDQRYNAAEAEALRQAQTTSGIRARRRAKRALRENGQG